MTTVLWLSLLLIIYCYFGYPFAIWFICRFYNRPIKKTHNQPKVALLLSCYNEEEVIEQKIKNLLELNYPVDKLDIWVGSDGSTDKTNELVKKFNNKQVHLIEQDTRTGKMAMINLLVQKSQGEIIVFNDARQALDKNALQELVNNFQDPQIGCVSGELIFTKEQSSTGQGINLYWEYEKFIRRYESQMHSMIGATGAIYAIRRKLFTPIPVNVILDDVFVPLKIVQKGYRAILDGSAKAYDNVAQIPREEYQRKTRTLFGNYQMFALFPHLFNPFSSPLSIQLFSHKLLRVLVPILMILIFVANTFLLSLLFYQYLLSAQIAFYVMALIGFLLRGQKYGILGNASKICIVPYVFCLLNFSALSGLFRYLFAQQTVTWKKASE